MTFIDGNFFELEGTPYCELHYYIKKQLICSSCQCPIKGKCMTTSSGKRFHPEHFNCSYCSKRLQILDFKEKNGKCYCLDCHRKLHG